ncbi:major head protein [Eggerthella phage PMBT5]|uniref:Major capsid protein n=1 Tax=Eggerthella phage PMBT5 TaxID=2283015 RepID=A0A345MKD0_9CAUD|nr:major head protein [Eggerthella phage PMBT5]AXH71793.1 major capsid protein [Eggerthella phage PMBT5]
MANSITKFKAYTSMLDEVYKLASLTSVLDINDAMVQAGANANEIVIPKISMDGMADYSRSAGYVGGDVTLTNETVQFNYDRGRSFTVDSMDNEETAGVAFGRLSSEFIRTKAAPEIDAFRFATYCGLTGIGKATAATYSTVDTLLAAINAGVTSLDEAEVPDTERYLFITPTLYNLAMSADTTKSKEMLDGFAQITKVPQSRFYTSIDLQDGTTSGEEAGGFSKTATTGKDINFMIIHKPALLQYSKHVVNKVVTPEENQTSDGWKFFYRSYGLADAYENKVSGIYLSNKA